MTHWALFATIVFGVVAMLGPLLFLAWLYREMRQEAAESLQALRMGQEHIAALTAEVLRRIR